MNIYSKYFVFIHTEKEHEHTPFQMSHIIKFDAQMCEHQVMV